MDRSATRPIPVLCIGEVILKPELELPQGARIVGCNITGHDHAIRLVYEYQGPADTKETRFFHYTPLAPNSETLCSYHGFKCHVVATTRDAYQTYVVYERVRMKTVEG